MVTLKQFRIVIASPSDVKEEREALDKVIERVNRNTAENLGLILKAVRWETESYPGFHIDGPQGLIDPRIKIEDCDILICIFWKRFGTPIEKDGKTGTEHEFYKAYEAWKQNRTPHIMLYFNQKEYVPRNPEESKQQTYVLEFKRNLPKECLFWNYNGLEEFKEFVHDHITAYLNRYSIDLEQDFIHAIPEIVTDHLDKIENSIHNSSLKEPSEKEINQYIFEIESSSDEKKERKFMNLCELAKDKRLYRHKSILELCDKYIQSNSNLNLLERALDFTSCLLFTSINKDHTNEFLDYAKSKYSEKFREIILSTDNEYTNSQFYVKQILERFDIFEIMELRKLYWKVIISNIINSNLERQDFINKISNFFPKIKEYDDEFRIECRSELYNMTLNNDEKIKQRSLDLMYFI